MQSDLTRLTGNIKYPLPWMYRKAAAVKAEMVLSLKFFAMAVKEDVVKRYS